MAARSPPYRKLAEAALARLDGHLPMGAPWTAEVALPGGDFPVEGFDAQVTALIRDFPFLSSETAIRLMRAYGTRARRFLDGHDDLGRLSDAVTSARTNLAYLARYRIRP